MSDVGRSIIGGEAGGGSSVYGRDVGAFGLGILVGIIECRDMDCPISSPNRVVARGETVAGTGSGRA